MLLEMTLGRMLLQLMLMGMVGDGNSCVDGNDAFAGNPCVLGNAVNNDEAGSIGARNETRTATRTESKSDAVDLTTRCQQVSIT